MTGISHTSGRASRRRIHPVLLLAGLALTPAAAASTATAAPQPVVHGQGTFAAICEFTHRAPDDPIVVPGEPGHSHMHDFFGNTATDAFSTNRLLRKSSTECTRPADHSAYWVPTLGSGETVDAAGNPIGVQPIVAQAYYRNNLRDPTTVQPFPRGLRVVAGDPSGRPQDPMRVGWTCSMVGFPAPKVLEPEPPTCGPLSNLYARVFFPDCSNGKPDSRNHKRHMAWSSRERGERYATCPRSHPIPVPGLRLTISYPPNAGAGTQLSSGGRLSFHADFFEAWKGRTLSRLIHRCFVGDLACKAFPDDSY